MLWIHGVWLRILRTSLHIAVWPQPILSSAVAAQRMLDFVATRRLCCHFRYQNFSLIFKSVTCFLGKPRVCFMFQLPNLHLHAVIVCFTVSCQSIDKVLPRSHFILMSGSKKLSLLMDQSTSSCFLLIIQSFSCSLCDQLNRFLGSKNCRYTSRTCDRYCICQGFAPVWIGIGQRLWIFYTGSLPARENVTNS